MPVDEAVKNLMLRDKKIENPLIPWEEKCYRQASPSS